MLVLSLILTAVKMTKQISLVGGLSDRRLKNKKCLKILIPTLIVFFFVVKDEIKHVVK